jgi:hypothetical protein
VVVIPAVVIPAVAVVVVVVVVVVVAVVVVGVVVVVVVVVGSADEVEGFELAIGGKAPHSVTIRPFNWFVWSKVLRSKARSKHQPLLIGCGR